MNDEIILINTDEKYFQQSVILSGNEYRLVFKWNGTSKYWTLSLLTEDSEEIFLDRKIVCDYPLFAFCSHPLIPSGKLFAINTTDSKDPISENDLNNGRIILVYINEQT